VLGFFFFVFFRALDYVVVGSDSGRIVILEYNPEKNVFVKVHEETYGKSAVRRVVPGEYLAADPKGRAVMIGRRKKPYFFILFLKAVFPL